MTTDIIQQIRECAKKKILYLPHAVRQMSKPDRMISPIEVRYVIEYGEIIENYPADPRGHSCLLIGFPDKNCPIHIVCAPKDEYLAIITAYIPNDSEWEKNYKERKKQ